MTHDSTLRLRRTRSLATAAVIAALYVVLTLPFAQFAFGPVQFRLAEILVVLPILTGAAIPGVILGCFLSNLLNPMNLGIIDIVFGTLATGLAAVLTRYLYTRLSKKRPLLIQGIALTPPVVINALIVGTYLSFLLSGDDTVTLAVIGINIFYIALSEAFVVYVIGFPLLLVLQKSGLRRLWA